MGLGRDSLPRWLGYLESTSQPRWILEVKKKETKNRFGWSLGSDPRWLFNFGKESRRVNSFRLHL